MAKISDLMLYEEVLLRIEKRHNANELRLPLDKLVALKAELRKLGEITDVYLAELKRIEGREDAEEIEIEMLGTELCYDEYGYRKIVESKEVIDFFCGKEQK